MDKSEIEKLNERFDNLPDEKKQYCIWLESGRLPDKCKDRGCDGYSKRNYCREYTPLNDKFGKALDKLREFFESKNRLKDEKFADNLYESLEKTLRFLEDEGVEEN